jgi:hypothetical protein
VLFRTLDLQRKRKACGGRGRLIHLRPSAAPHTLTDALKKVKALNGQPVTGPSCGFA